MLGRGRPFVWTIYDVFLARLKATRNWRREMVEREEKAREEGLLSIRTNLICRRKRRLSKLLLPSRLKRKDYTSFVAVAVSFVSLRKLVCL